MRRVAGIRSCCLTLCILAVPLPAAAGVPQLQGTACGMGGAGGVAITATGDVLAAGHTENVGSGRDATVVRLDGASGAVEWRLDVDGTAPEALPPRPEAAIGVIENGAGDVLAQGMLDMAGA